MSHDILISIGSAQQSIVPSQTLWNRAFGFLNSSALQLPLPYHRNARPTTSWRSSIWPPIGATTDTPRCPACIFYSTIRRRRRQGLNCARRNVGICCSLVDILCASSVFASRPYSKSRNRRWHHAHRSCMYLLRTGASWPVLTKPQALIFAESALVTKAVEHGIGRHMFFVGPVEFVYALKWQIIAMPFAIIGACVPKLVVTMLLIKILNPGKLAAAFLWTLNIVLFSISISTSVVALVQCTPTSAQWTHAGNFTCWDPKISTNVGLSQGCKLDLLPLTLTDADILRQHLELWLISCWLSTLLLLSGTCR